jgi:rod shape-determining protein MreD
MSRAAAPLALLVLALLAIHLPLVPVSHGAERAALPDLLFGLVASWVLLRPDTLPLLLVVGLGLLADLLLGRPLGLGALGLVAASELLRGRRLGFLRGWWATALAFALVVAGTWLALTLALLPAPRLDVLAWHWLATVAAYPLAVLLVRGAFRLGAAA